MLALVVATLLIPTEGFVSEGIGLTLAGLWLVSLLAWFVGGWMNGTLRFRFTWIDASVLGLCGWCAIASFVQADQADLRAARNGIWLWISAGVAYWLMRQLVDSNVARRTVIRVMLSLVVSICLFGVYQYSVVMPQLRAAWQNDPEAVLGKLGVAAPEGSPEREQIRNRIESREPYSTFALANSFAGFLVPWLVLLVAWLVVSLRGGRRPRNLRPFLGLTLLVFAALALTQSRAAMLAVMVSILLVIAMTWLPRWSVKTRWLLAVAGGMCLLLVGCLLWIGMPDAEFLSEAPKSVLYRVQYWQASAAMAIDHPLFGCGTGNYQQFYTAYKLPEASETISDPHNFFVELFSIAGAPAAVLVIVVFVLVAMLKEDESEAWSSSTHSDEAPLPSWGISVAILVGFVTAMLCEITDGSPLDPFVLWFGLPVAMAVAWILPEANLDTLVRGRWLRIALLGLMLNLLAAGGVTFPAILLVILLLLAMTVDAHDIRSWDVSIRKIACLTGAVLTLVSILGFQRFTYGPLMQTRLLVAEARDLHRHGYSDQAAETLEAAGAADPSNAQPWLLLSQHHHQALLSRDDSTAGEKMLLAMDAATDRSLRSSKQQQRFGDLALSAYRRTGDNVYLNVAVDRYERAVTLYPNGHFEHAILAWAKWVAGDTIAARQHAETSLQIDAQHPHQEQKLQSRRIHDTVSEVDDRQQFRMLAESSNIKQLMLALCGQDQSFPDQVIQSDSGQ